MLEEYVYEYCVSVYFVLKDNKTTHDIWCAYGNDDYSSIMKTVQ